MTGLAKYVISLSLIISVLLVAFAVPAFADATVFLFPDPAADGNFVFCVGLNCIVYYPIVPGVIDPIMDPDCGTIG